MHLLDIQHWIEQGVMPWIWEKPSGFGDGIRDASVSNVLIGCKGIPNGFYCGNMTACTL